MKKLFELIRNQHNSIYRISLFVFAILIGVYLMPRKKSFKHEPIEELSIDIPEIHSGKAIEVVAIRKGEMLSMSPKGDRMLLEFQIILE